MSGLSTRGRITIAAAVTVALAAAGIGYVQLARTRAAADTVPAASTELTLDSGPGLLVVSGERLAVVSRTDPSGARQISGVACARAYAAAGTAVCIQPDTAWSYQLVVLDRQLRPTRSFAIPGLPNRARVSPTGRMIAWTTFVGGDSYSTSGFSTRTGILDTHTGTQVTTLEDFAITHDGKPYRNTDVNYWGVTFTTDDNTFYATMATAGVRHLIRGDLAAKTVHTITTNVECPSLSPDGTRIAFKQAVDSDPQRGWRLSVMDLATHAVTHLAETRSVDDQAAWLDDHTIAYTLRAPDGEPSIWTAPADGTGTATPLLPHAESPAALH
ncbi:PD40 domain-containing protein [Catellatospora bangladeshensis]|uniref:TolB-like translocation protein signal peptide n=1 Tax=Catellatospora bangladeshensis TaxID=310355 RepID=A0A8J3NK58_9ACTN|nr:PD40 domain-containing protein [Catellatospora bangladeshensis]GIF82708.1 TolB-like translocation protein; signal peptide [Catellatospora bangladeshensis]